MKKIEKEIQKRIANKTVFVFPTAAEAHAWFLRSLDITGLTSIAADVFLAWDIFKEKYFYANQKASPITQVIRKIFVQDILKKNKEAANETEPIFQYIIPKDCATNSDHFSSWLLTILPQLDNLNRKMQKHSYMTDVLQEFLVLKKQYELFLERHHLYEPSWNTTSICKHETNIVIFFPELIEDFYEIAHLLSEDKKIEYIYTDSLDSTCMYATEFQNSRLEIEYCISEIETLLSAGVETDKIAISVCDLEQLKPYIEREAHIRNIPISFRLGEKLGKTQIGSLFRLLSEIVRSGFTFNAMQILFMNMHFPWKNRTLVDSLLRFGSEFCCVTSWEENDTRKNVWEEAFRSLDNAKTKEQYECQQFFMQFKMTTEKLVNAKTFDKLRETYITFRDTLFDMSNFSEADNLILSSCIEKLQSLCLLELEFNDELPHARFDFFTNLLDDSMYVFKGEEGSISIFPFQVMAISPFEYNFLLNAGQKEVKAIFNHLSFLRDDVRTELNTHDVDASTPFLRCYCNNSNAHISYSLKTFTDYAMKHASLKRKDRDILKHDNNSFLSEKKYLDSKVHDEFLLYSMQKTGIENFCENYLSSTKNQYSILKNKIPDRLKELTYSELNHRNYIVDGKVKVSQAQLADFSQCHTAFFLKRILKLSKEEFPVLLSSFDLGNLSHKIIQEIFSLVMERFGKIQSGCFEKLKEPILKIISNTISEFSTISKAFKQLLNQKKQDELFALLNHIGETYVGYTIPGIEKKIELHFDDCMLDGTIDCVFYNQAADAYDLYDFKSNTIPLAKDVRLWNDDDTIDNFQIAMYVLLLEKTSDKTKVKNAFFWSLNQKKYEQVMGEYIKSKKDYSREQFDSTLQFLNSVIHKFVDHIMNMDFKKNQEIHFKDCVKCEYKKICRTTFQVEGA